VVRTVQRILCDEKRAPGFLMGVALAVLAIGVAIAVGVIVWSR
jgi:hypothetical protein